MRRNTGAAVVALSVVVWGGAVRAEQSASERVSATSSAASQGLPSGPGASVTAQTAALSATKPNAPQPHFVRRSRPARASLEKRAEKLKQRATELRAAGQAEQAARVERQAELLAKHPRTGRPPGAAPPAQRKRVRIKRWYRRYGEALRRPEVQAELRLHGLRLAKLQRMKELAQQHSEAERRERLLQRISALQGRESARHQRVMARVAAPDVGKAQQGEAR